MLWNFPSFSFLEIGNIKLLFETGLSTSEPRFHENSFTTDTELNLIRTAKYDDDKLNGWWWSAKDVGSTISLVTWRKCRASTLCSAQSLWGTWRVNLISTLFLFFYWDTILHYLLYLWMRAYLIFPPMLLNWSLKQIDNSQITLRGASVTWYHYVAPGQND